MNPYICVQVDWDDDGDFTDTHENISSLIRTKQGIVASRGNDQIQDLSPPMSGSFNLTVDNTDQLFSVENILSDLYGYLVPGHTIRLKIFTFSVQFTITANNGYCYSKLDSAPASYTLQTGDILYYDIKWETATDFISFDLGTAGAIHILETAGAKDQNGLSVGYATDISAYALNSYYTRVIPVPVSAVGSIITRFQVACRNPLSGTYQSDFQNIYILSSDGTVHSIFQSPESLNITDTNTNNGSSDSCLLEDSKLWQGNLDNIQQNSAQGQISATLPAFGTLSKLVGKKISTQLLENVTTDVALIELLTVAGIDPSLIDPYIGNTTLDWWWLDNEDAFQAATTLLYSEGPGAKLYEDRDGSIVLENRQHRFTDAGSTTSQYTLNTTGDTSNAAFRTYTYDPGLKNIVNSANAVQKTRAADVSPSIVWFYPSGDIITLAPNEVWSVQTSATDPFKDAVVPNPGTNYAIISGSVTPSLSATSGTIITITMTAGASGCSFGALSLTATSVPITATVTVNSTVDTSASQATYGLRVFNLPLRAEISVNTMQDLVNAIASTYSQPRATVTFGIMSADGGINYNIQRGLQISNRVTVIEGQSAFNGDVWIESISHTILSGTNFMTTYGAEKIIETLYGTWGSAVWDLSVWGF